MKTFLPAKGKKGFLIFDPFRGRAFFRIYTKSKTAWKDFEIMTDEVQVQIVDKDVILNQENKSLDYNPALLGS